MKYLFIVQGEGRGHLTQAIALEEFLRNSGHEVVEILVGKSNTRELPAFFSRNVHAPEGRGHLTQAIALEEFLRNSGHEVVEILVGKSNTRELPAFFSRNVHAPVKRFESPNFLPTASNKRNNLTKSILYNITQLPIYARSMRFINERIAHSGADMVINFYELLTGLTYTFFRIGIPQVCIGHQYLFLHKDFEFPKKNLPGLMLLKFFTRLTALGAKKKLALSFCPMNEDKQNSIRVVPPLLRKEVFLEEPSTGNYIHGYMVNSGFSENVKEWHNHHPEVPLRFFWDKKNEKGINEEPSTGNYIHGYMVNSGFSENVKEWHNHHPEVPLRFFWDKKNEKGIKKIDNTLSFYPLDDAEFLRQMSGCRAYASTAGFESVCEAMYLGKPVLMVPAHIEQDCNAFDAAKNGAGVISSDFNLDKLMEFAKEYNPNPHFCTWVESAPYIIGYALDPDIYTKNSSDHMYMVEEFT